MYAHPNAALIAGMAPKFIARAFSWDIEKAEASNRPQMTRTAVILHASQPVGQHQALDTVGAHCLGRRPRLAGQL